MNIATCIYLVYRKVVEQLCLPKVDLHLVDSERRCRTPAQLLAVLVKLAFMLGTGRGAGFFCNGDPVRVQSFQQCHWSSLTHLDTDLLLLILLMHSCLNCYHLWNSSGLAFHLPTRTEFAWRAVEVIMLWSLLWVSLAVFALPYCMWLLG